MGGGMYDAVGKHGGRGTPHQIDDRRCRKGFLRCGVCQTFGTFGLGFRGRASAPGALSGGHHVDAVGGKGNPADFAERGLRTAEQGRL
jgi:hypothetical protein